MNRHAIRFLGAVGFQFLLLLSVIGFKQYTIWTGRTVLLKVVPVDPRSLLSGDYVHLRAQISTPPPVPAEAAHGAVDQVSPLPQGTGAAAERRNDHGSQIERARQ